jgi:hypothetical protein
MTVRLRPHHLLCMLTFAGKGYTSQFVAQFESVVERLLAGQESIEVVAGPDEICSTMDEVLERHCTNDSVALRDEQAATSIAQLLHRPIEEGVVLALDQPFLAKMRSAFAAGTIRSGCSGCQWKTLCDEISECGFKKSRLAFPEN